MGKEVLESLWAPYPCQGLCYLEMDGLENDHPKVFPSATGFFFKIIYSRSQISFLVHTFWNDFMMLFWQEVLISKEIPLGPL